MFLVVCECWIGGDSDMWGKGDVDIVWGGCRLVKCGDGDLWGGGE